MREFWVHSGLALLDLDDDNHLVITDDFLRAYLRRPELELVAESCLAENKIHALLQHAPRDAMDASLLANIADVDVRENWQMFARFRDYLLQAATVEQAYLNILTKAQSQGKVDVPPLFVDQLAHIILHQAMVNCEDGVTLRIAELWFRDQRVSLVDGHAMLADEETVENRSETQGLGDLGRLLAQARIQAKDVDLNVLDSDNADEYFGRDERHDFAIDISHGRTAAERMCQVVSAWVHQMLGVEVRVRTLREVSDQRWRWHIGLSAEGSNILNQLYNEQAMSPEQARQILWLGRLDFVDIAQQRADMRGKPVYLALAMDAEGRLRCKPQNLILNLPLAQEPGASGLSTMTLH